ncbi:MAG: hypothetical protein QGH30_08655, partial [Candidatus Krumholzibacteria bacterium]|nr:hypothetical protein [Candidatus Krumholzibacteria bacterium]
RRGKSGSWAARRGAIKCVGTISRPELKYFRLALAEELQDTPLFPDRPGREALSSTVFID